MQFKDNNLTFYEKCKLFDIEVLTQEYKSDNPVATKCIEWLNEWANESIKIINDYVSGDTDLDELVNREDIKLAISCCRQIESHQYEKEVLIKGILFRRCGLSQVCIELAEKSLLTYPYNYNIYDPDFVKAHEGLFKKMILCNANEDYKGCNNLFNKLFELKKEFNQ